MSYDRGDVVVAADPFRNDDVGRPFLVVSQEGTPFHGAQYITLSLTTRTWYDECIPVDSRHWIDGSAPESSSIMPWSVTSVKDEWIEYRQGTLGADLVDRAVAELTEYVQ